MSQAGRKFLGALACYVSLYYHLVKKLKARNGQGRSHLWVPSLSYLVASDIRTSLRLFNCNLTVLLPWALELVKAFHT